LPQATRFVALVKPNTVFTDAVVKDLQASARPLGLPLEILHAGTSNEIDAAFVNLAQKPGSALLTSPDAFFTSRRAQIVTLAARHGLPAICNQREFAEIGGLVSYGPSPTSSSCEASPLTSGPTTDRSSSPRPRGNGSRLSVPRPPLKPT
jgi:putative ABC transport system substrate-binding protein